MRSSVHGAQGSPNVVPTRRASLGGNYARRISESEVRHRPVRALGIGETAGGFSVTSVSELMDEVLEAESAEASARGVFREPEAMDGYSSSDGNESDPGDPARLEKSAARRSVSKRRSNTIGPGGREASVVRRATERASRHDAAEQSRDSGTGDGVIVRSTDEAERIRTHRRASSVSEPRGSVYASTAPPPPTISIFEEPGPESTPEPVPTLLAPIEPDIASVSPSALALAASFGNGMLGAMSSEPHRNSIYDVMQMLKQSPEISRRLEEAALSAIAGSDGDRLRMSSSGRSTRQVKAGASGEHDANGKKDGADKESTDGEGRPSANPASSDGSAAAVGSSSASTNTHSLDGSESNQLAIAAPKRFMDGKLEMQHEHLGAGNTSNIERGPSLIMPGPPPSGNSVKFHESLVHADELEEFLNPPQPGALLLRTAELEAAEDPSKASCRRHLRAESMLINKNVITNKYVPLRKPRSYLPAGATKKAPPLPKTPPEIHPPIAKDPIFSVPPEILLRSLLKVQELTTRASLRSRQWSAAESKSRIDTPRDAASPSRRTRTAARNAAREAAALAAASEAVASAMAAAAASSLLKNIGGPAAQSILEDVGSRQISFSDLMPKEGPYYVHPWVQDATATHLQPHCAPTPREHAHSRAQTSHTQQHETASSRDPCHTHGPRTVHVHPPEDLPEHTPNHPDGRRWLLESMDAGSVMSLSEFQIAMANEDFQDLSHTIVPITRFTPTVVAGAAATDKASGADVRGNAQSRHSKRGASRVGVSDSLMSPTIASTRRSRSLISPDGVTARQDVTKPGPQNAEDSNAHPQYHLHMQQRNIPPPAFGPQFNFDSDEVLQRLIRSSRNVPVLGYLSVSQTPSTGTRTGNDTASFGISGSTLTPTSQRGPRDNGRVSNAAVGGAGGALYRRIVAGVDSKPSTSHEQHAPLPLLNQLSVSSLEAGMGELPRVAREAQLPVRLPSLPIHGRCPTAVATHFKCSSREERMCEVMDRPQTQHRANVRHNPGLGYLDSSHDFCTGDADTRANFRRTGDTQREPA
ncbi:hypothetical protein HK105_204136 [Polyrhizophydium stewartii]|uniref:Uncharacterized protein n=1 Tax=Polyrhizophydium stewartii TaxID=2732419 RepID=A0ABR4NA36_9FUNG